MKIEKNEIEKVLKEKKILYSLWDCESDTGWTNYQFDYPLRKIFGKVIKFDPRMRRFLYGPELMKKKFISLIMKEKPEFIFLMVGSDEMNIDTLLEIKRISPNSKTIILLTDEDVEFEVFSRYYALFADFCMVTQPKYLKLYKKDKLKNGFPMLGLNLDLFKPEKTKKVYNVSFVGQQYPPRLETIRFLLKNGIKVNIWGPGWLNYKDLSELIKGGAVNVQKYINITNKSKITLGLIKNKYGHPHISHRPFEVAACKSFQLLDFAPEYRNHFKDGKEVIFFKSNEELLEKIKFYLKNDEKREKIAENSYKKIVKNYDITKSLKNFFEKVNSLETKTFKLSSKVNKKLINLKIDDLSLNLSKIKELTEGYNYVSISDSKIEKNKYKEFLQIRSLEKTGKEISCCDYSIKDKTLGDLLIFKSYRYFKLKSSIEFHKLLNLNQIIIKKDYFLKNLNKISRFSKNQDELFINDKNTAFVSIPLFKVENISKSLLKMINRLNKQSMDIAFQVNFLYYLYSLFKRKKLFLDKYLYLLFVKSITKNYYFILKYLINSSISKESLSKFKSLNSN